MKIGYIRVSSIDQNLDRQEELMKKIGVEKIYADKKSGKNVAREAFKEMMSYIREGDTLYCESFSRLSRSTKDLLNIVEQLNIKKVTLISDKERLDTSSPQGKFMLTVFAAMSELERESILERQKEGIAIAKANGKYKGRPSGIDDHFKQIAKKWQCGELKLKDAIFESGVSEPTFFRRCKTLGIGRESIIKKNK